MNLIQFEASDLKQLVKEYNSGETLASLSENWGYALSTIRRLLIQGGVTIRPRGRRKGH